jgi:DNA replication protein DnaC
MTNRNNKPGGHASKCLLVGKCKIANSDACNPRCNAFIGAHGLSGSGGRVGAANVPEEYRLMTVATSPARGSQAEAYRLLDAYTQSFDRQFEDAMQAKIEQHMAKGLSEYEAKNKARIKSLFLWSKSTGTGKSVSASAVVNEYLIANYLGSLKRGIQPHARPAYFQSVNELQTLHNKMHSPASMDVKERIGNELLRLTELAKKTPMVVLDDLGVRTATQSFIAVLFEILDYRSSHGLATVTTTNKSPDELKQLFRTEDEEGKVVDRLLDMASVIHYIGESKRGKR